MIATKRLALFAPLPRCTGLGWETIAFKRIIRIGSGPHEPVEMRGL